MKKRIISLVLAVCLLVGLCPMFASASRQYLFIVDIDGTVHDARTELQGNGWIFNKSTKTLTLKGYTGRCVFGQVGGIALEKNTENHLAAIVINGFAMGDEVTISGSGNLDLEYDDGLLDYSQFKWGEYYSDSSYESYSKYYFPCVLTYENFMNQYHPTHGKLVVKSGLTLSGGKKAGDKELVSLVERENLRVPSHKTDTYFTQTAEYSGGKASYVRIAPLSSTTPKPSEPSVGGFNDVYEDDYYADAVMWAVENGITGGVGSGKFAPKQACTRGQIATFLWNAAGKPEPQSTANPFVDVKPGDYFYKPVLWAMENKITSGTDSTHFSPTDPCTRDQAVTFLWRSEGKPVATEVSSFTDVKAGSFYETAVNWAVENKVTSGTSKNSFSPGQTCTRGQIVTFLYRTKEG